MRRLAVLALAFWPTWSLPCSCAWPSKVTEDMVVQEFCAADVVMVGTASTKVDVGRSVAKYEIVPDRVYKGSPTTPTPMVSWMGGLCGYPFDLGKRYLIYASVDTESGYLTASICSLTAEAEYKSFDLRILDKMASEAGSLCTNEAIQDRRRRMILDRYREAGAGKADHFESIPVSPSRDAANRHGADGPSTPGAAPSSSD